MELNDTIQYDDVEQATDLEIPHEVRNLTTQAYDKSVSDIII